MWPLSVAGTESGRYFWIARAVNTGHVQNCVLLIDFTSVCFGGLSAAWRKYLMSASFYVMENVLYAMFLVLLVSILGDVKLLYFDGNIHNRVCGSLTSFHISFYYNRH